MLKLMENAFFYKHYIFAVDTDSFCTKPIKEPELGQFESSFSCFAFADGL